MGDQIDDLLAKNTYNPICIPPPKNRKDKSLSGMWRYTVNINAKTEIHGFQTTWVICANHQMKDRKSVFYTPVISDVFTKLVRSIIVPQHSTWRHFDVKTVYSNALQNDEVVLYMRQPHRFEYL